ncbi:choline ethanolamine kinase family [Cryptosporidium sp. chipmunk genotype I]|uniref:choline ethanolamine kinase family n=1 Tax=Cryptosporidium sp. chipmunk genotype I TaxID=1280935 RepID=UPI00351A40CB|nr:choline ethanolamine kinase family [Cryptosporidium sp. chipmunk genotype I]
MTWNIDLSKSKLREAEKVSWKLFRTGICKCCNPEKLTRSKILTGGLSNILVLVSISTDLFCEDMKRINKNILIPNLKVRFYSEERKIFVNEKREQLIQNLLANAGIIKPILHYFQGGQIEEFVEGRTLEVEDLRNKSTYIQVAKKIASLHSIKISQEILENICLEYDNTHQNLKVAPCPESNNQPISILWPTLEKWASLSEEVLKLNRKEYYTDINFEKLRILIRKLKKSLYSDPLSKLTCSIVVSHSDLLPGNIIETLSNNYTFIDYEFSGTMECVFDIGNHLCEWAGFTCNWEYLPDDETISEFLKYYIAGLSNNRYKGNESKYKKGGDDKNTNNLNIKMDELENNYQYINHEIKEAFQLEHSDPLPIIKAYVKAVKTCMVISNVFWGLWGICKSDIGSNNSSNSIFDYKSYGYRKLESINTETYFRNILKGIDQDIEFPVF